MEDPKSIERRSSLLSKVYKGLKWMLADFRKPDLIWVKIIFFLQSASLVTLYPYISLHMRSLGFNMEDASIVNSVIPVADILGPPLAGVLADRIGNFRIFMAMITFLNGVSALFLLTLPKLDSAPMRMKCCFNSTENFGSSELFPCFSDNDNDEIQYMGRYNFTFEDNTKNESSYAFIEDQHSDNGDEFLDAIDNFSCRSELKSKESKILVFTTMSDAFTNISSKNFDIFEEVTCETGTKNWRHPLFWKYLLIRIALDVLRASSLMLFEGALIVTIKEQGGDYGLQKLFGTAGTVIFGPLAGLLIDVVQKNDADVNYLRMNNEQIVDFSSNGYYPIIYLYFALRIVAALCILKLRLDFKPPAKKVFQNIRTALFRFDVMSYLIVFFVAGTMWGFLESFLFWYMEDLGATKLLLGISLGAGTLTAIPLTILSHLLLKNIGHNFIALIALGVYAVRMLSYSYIGNIVSLCILLEALKPFCTTLLLISTMTFVKDVSPLTIAASMEGIFGSLYFGVGRGLGGFLGGVTTEHIGFIETFKLFGILSLCTGVFYQCSISLNERIKLKRKSLQNINSVDELSKESLEQCCSHNVPDK